MDDRLEAYPTGGCRPHRRFRPDYQRPWQTEYTLGLAHPVSRLRKRLSIGYSMTSSTTQKSNGMWIIAALVVLLLILHQDNWFWTDDTLVFGFMPIGLFWHACISIGASLTWALATVIAWPLADEADENGDVSSTEEAAS